MVATPTRSCYHRPKQAGEVCGIPIYGAAGFDLTAETTPPGINRLLVLNGGATSEIKPKLAVKNAVLRAPRGFEHLKEVANLDAPSVDEIVFNWPDYGVVDLYEDFWNDVLGHAKDYDAIIATCMGGHGRTGTILASLMIMGNGCSAQEAVKRVRSDYCDKAIESDSQIDYLIALSWVVNGTEETAYEVDRDYK